MSKIKYCWNCKCEVPYQFYNNIDYIPKCPKCGVSYPEKPKDEALLSIYQDEYLKDRSEKNFNRLFTLLNRVTFNIIRHKLKANSSYEQLDDIWDKVQWTLEKLMKYYTEKENFKISTSFVQYISQVVLYPLYNKDEKEKKEKEISIHTPKFSNSKNAKELNDYLSKDTDGGISEAEINIDYETDCDRLVKESIEFIKTTIDSLYNYEINIDSHKEFRNCLYMANLYKYFIYGEMKEDVVDEIMDSMDLELIERFNESQSMYKKILIEYANNGV